MLDLVAGGVLEHVSKCINGRPILTPTSNEYLSRQRLSAKDALGQFGHESRSRVNSAIHQRRPNMVDVGRVPIDQKRDRIVAHEQILPPVPDDIRRVNHCEVTPYSQRQRPDVASAAEPDARVLGEPRVDRCIELRKTPDELIENFIEPFEMNVAFGVAHDRFPFPLGPRCSGAARKIRRDETRAFWLHTEELHDPSSDSSTSRRK